MNRDDIVDAIRLVESSRLPDDPAERAKLVRGDVRLLGAIFGSEHDARNTRLSPREAEVAQLTACGLTRAETAARMGVETETVKTLLCRALRKTGARNAAHLSAIVVARTALNAVRGK